MAVDYFLKLDGIEGESKDSKHQNEIEIGSFSFGATQSGSFSAMGGGGSGKVSMQDFHFTIPTQKASPKLLLNCSSFQTGGSSETPMDQVSLNFAKIEVEYKEQKADGTLGGSIKAGYDLKQMKEV